MATHKYPFGIIGNCAYHALVDTDANIAWCCMPRYDSSFLFGTLLDDDKGGNFSIQPEWDTYTSSQQYAYNTNILETTFDCEDGQFKVIDFAPRFQQYERYYKPLFICRKIVPLKGRPRVRIRCNPMGDYGETKPQRVFGSSHIRYVGLKHDVRLTTNVPLTYIDNEQAFVLNDVKYLVLAYGVPLEMPLESSVESFLEKTTKYWQNWVKATSIENFEQEAVIRSALVLKILQFQDTGAIVAAGTTSLPESPRSTRNWDYRYCFLRDAHYMIKALSDTGHFTILEDFAGFIENIVLNEHKRFKPLYSIAIDHEPRERNMPLKGYLGERPVRVGNRLLDNIQNDVYGQILLTLLPFFNDKRLLSQGTANLTSLVHDCLSMIENTFDEPDNGPWGFMADPQSYCYTYLFHWAGSHAAKKIAQSIGDVALEQTADALIERSAQQLETFKHPDGHYRSTLDSDELDASLLLLITMGYLEPNSAAAAQHLAALEQQLKRANGLFTRYQYKDDFGTSDMGLLVCSFWYVEALARMNRLDAASATFKQVLSFANHLGLLSDSADPETGSQWGNFPMTNSHVALINAAFALSKKYNKPNYL